jgi:hypothetical protein
MSPTIDALVYKLASQARAMETENKPPYETEPVELSIGDLTLICKALHLLDVVRASVSK